MENNLVRKKSIIIIFFLIAFVLILVPYKASAYFNTYYIESVVDYNTLILSRMGSYYETNFSFGCSFYSLDLGKSISIDSFLSPSYGDSVVYDDFFSTDICEVGFGSAQLNIKSYNIIETTGTDKVLIESNDFIGTRYLVEYGLGCSRLWYKSFGEIHIDVGGSFLNGIGDRIYLFDDNQDCKVWDADEVDSGSSYTPINTTPVTTCPDMTNGYLGINGICYCNFGYIWNDSTYSCTKSPSNINTNEIDLVSFIDEERNLLSNIDSNLSSRLNGKILLQVEKNGEGWYVYPDNNKKYYLGRPSDAFSIMRNLGLGATHEFITSHEIYPNRVVGKILLDVELNGEAYYIYPDDKKAYYLGRPSDAFDIMRTLGLGITNTDVRKIDIGDLSN